MEKITAKTEGISPFARSFHAGEASLGGHRSGRDVSCPLPERFLAVGPAETAAVGNVGCGAAYHARCLPQAGFWPPETLPGRCSHSFLKFL